MNTKLIALPLAGLLMSLAVVASAERRLLIEDSVGWQFRSPDEMALLQARVDLMERKKNGFYNKGSGGFLAAAGGGGAGGSVIGNFFQSNYEITIDGEGNTVQGGEVDINGDQLNQDSSMKAQSNAVNSGSITAQ